MEQPTTLTVGIPTYNGSAYIREALDSVISQITDDLMHRVDILVSDNASTDGINDIIKMYQASYPVKIEYSRNNTNIGYDRNVDMLFKKASGKYVWLLGDDDVWKEGALLYVLKLLDTYPSIKAVQINFEHYDRKLERLVHYTEISEDSFCHDAETFLRKGKGKYGNLSSLVLSRAAWNAEDLSFGFGLKFIHVYGLMKILLRGDSYIVHEPLVKVRLVPPTYLTDGDSLLGIALDSGTIVHSMKKMGYDPSIIRWLIRDTRRYTFYTIPNAKLVGLKNKSIAARRLIKIHNSPALWLKWLPVIFCPDSIFKHLYPLKKRISSKTRNIERVLKGYLKKTVT